MVDEQLVRMNEQVPRISEHTGVAALLDTDRRDNQPIESCVLPYRRECHRAVTAGHVTAKVEQEGGPSGIVVGGPGNASSSVRIPSAFSGQSANAGDDEFEPDLAVVKLHRREVEGLYRAPGTRFHDLDQVRPARTPNPVERGFGPGLIRVSPAKLDSWETGAVKTLARCSPALRVRAVRSTAKG